MDLSDSAHHPYRAPVRTVECVACHVRFLTRAGSGTLLCTNCRHHFRALRGRGAEPSQGDAR